MPNRLLGEYDMIFALSESKINAVLKQLFDHKTIASTWKFLTNEMDLDVYDLTSPDAKSSRRPWEWMDDVSVDFSKNFEPDYDWIKGKGDLRSRYQVNMDAILTAPTIKVLQDASDELLLKINIKSGTLSYLEGNSIKDVKFTNCTYAFRVPIVQVRIDAASMYLAGDDALQQLREEGLSNYDFTVDSIMLNFARADVARFVPSESVLPDADGLERKFTVAVAGYFRDLGKRKKNPYILGYALQKKVLSEREKSLLYPTGITFSTTFSDKERCSAFNFLMLTESQQFPKSERAGVRQHSLIELAQDITNTVSGVIAVNYSTFERTYLDALHKIVIENFENSFRNNSELSTVYKGYRILNSYNTYFEFSKHDLSMTLGLNRSEVVLRIDDKTDRQYLAVDYVITVWGNVHAEIERKVLGLFDGGTIGVDQTFSTTGMYPINNKTGSPGQLTLQIVASNEGKLNVEASYQPPAIGKNTEKPQTKDVKDDLWMFFTNVFSPLGIVGALINFLTDSANNSIVNFENAPFDSVSVPSFDSFATRVILPGSNVYTFKNISMVGNREHDDCFIKFDIAYAVAGVKSKNS